VKEQRPAPIQFAQRLRYVVACLGLLASGCPEPGDLEHVESFCKPGQSTIGANNQVIGCSDSPSGGGSGGGAATSCESACFTALVSGTCLTCHHAQAPLGQLDLESPGLSARLKDQLAKHAEVDNPQACPSGDKLIDSTTPSASWLLKKVSKQQGSCGTPMPPQGATMADIECVNQYVTCVGAAP
jgi:hypothetical protein